MRSYRKSGIVRLRDAVSPDMAFHPTNSNGRARSPLASVIIRTVNRPHYLVECVRSVVRQDYPNIEFIVINDGGPKIGELIAPLLEGRPHRIVELDVNHGRSESGNLGMRLSTGRYLCFLDDDDIFYPFHVSTLVSALERNDSKVVYSDALQASQILCPFDPRVYMTVKLTAVYSHDYSFETLSRLNFIPIQCVMFDRSCLDNGAAFDTMLDVLEDWDFWIQLGLSHDFLHLRQITSEYRQRLDGTNTVGQFEHRWQWSREYIADKHRDAITKRLDPAEQHRVYG